MKETNIRYKNMLWYIYNLPEFMCKPRGLNIKEKINFSTTRPKYNHLEIGDIVDFSNWPSKFKVYGATLSGYFMITDISKNINSSNIEVIKVS